MKKYQISQIRMIMILVLFALLLYSCSLEVNNEDYSQEDTIMTIEVKDLKINVIKGERKSIAELFKAKFIISFTVEYLINTNNNSRPPEVVVFLEWATLLEDLGTNFSNKREKRVTVALGHNSVEIMRGIQIPASNFGKVYKFFLRIEIYPTKGSGYKPPTDNQLAQAIFMIGVETSPRGYQLVKIFLKRIK